MCTRVDQVDDDDNQRTGVKNFTRTINTPTHRLKL